MFLSKRPNGIWYIIYQDVSGKRCMKSTRTKYKPIAEKHLRIFEQSFLDMQLQRVIPITLYEFRWKYLIYSESIHTPKTNKCFKTSFKFLMNYFGNIPLTDLTSSRIEDYLQHRIHSSSLFAARRDFINLSSAFSKAVRDEYLESNPFRKIKRIKIPERLPLFYSDQDIEKLIAVVEDNDLRDLIVFDLNTGLRLGEIMNLEWHQIDFKNKLLILSNRTFITKSKKIRTIPLNHTAHEIVLRRKESTSGNLVFTYRGKILNENTFSWLMKKQVKKAGINIKLNFHSLRHTFASRLVQKGVSIYIVSKLLGHADIKTTQIYAHLRTDDLRNSVNLLDS